jgi:hypothetical protein
MFPVTEMILECGMAFAEFDLNVEDAVFAVAK